MKKFLEIIGIDPKKNIHARSFNSSIPPEFDDCSGFRPKVKGEPDLGMITDFELVALF
ncbi:MAG: hypothetical protein WBL68_04845 [Nitrososphaeraceae archaeon]